MLDPASLDSNTVCACCVGGLIPKDIAAALADAQAAHNAAQTSLHASAALEGVPSAQQQDAAANDQRSAAGLDRTDDTSGAVAEAELEVDSTGITSAAVALAEREVDRTDITSAAIAEAELEGNSTDITSAAVAEAEREMDDADDSSAGIANSALKMASNDGDTASAASAENLVHLCSINNAPAAVTEADSAMQPTATSAVTAQATPPLPFDNSFSPCAERAKTACGLNTDVAHAHALIQDETPDTGTEQPLYPEDIAGQIHSHSVHEAAGPTSVQLQSAASSASMEEGETAVDARLQATGHGYSSVNSSQTASKGILHERNLKSEAAMGLLGLQLQRIRDSAVMLPEPAEVLVTDLLDHRLVALLCCAVLCSARKQANRNHLLRLCCSIANAYKICKLHPCIARLAFLEHNCNTHQLNQASV